MKRIPDSCVLPESKRARKLLSLQLVDPPLQKSMLKGMEMAELVELRWKEGVEDVVNEEIARRFPSYLRHEVGEKDRSLLATYLFFSGIPEWYLFANEMDPRDQNELALFIGARRKVQDGTKTLSVEIFELDMPNRKHPGRSPRPKFLIILPLFLMPDEEIEKWHNIIEQLEGYGKDLVVISKSVVHNFVDFYYTILKSNALYSEDDPTGRYMSLESGATPPRRPGTKSYMTQFGDFNHLDVLFSRFQKVPPREFFTEVENFSRYSLEGDYDSDAINPNHLISKFDRLSYLLDFTTKYHERRVHSLFKGFQQLPEEYAEWQSMDIK